MPFLTRRGLRQQGAAVCSIWKEAPTLFHPLQFPLASMSSTVSEGTFSVGKAIKASINSWLAPAGGSARDAPWHCLEVCEAWPAQARPGGPSKRHPQAQLWLWQPQHSRFSAAAVPVTVPPNCFWPLNLHVSIVKRGELPYLPLTAQGHAYCRFISEWH